MKSPLFSARQLEVLRSIILHNSVSEAAKSLGISQPSASAIVRRMEDVASIRLFKREAGRLAPTEEATKIMKASEPFFREFDRLATLIEGILFESSLFKIGHTNSLALPTAKAITEMKAGMPALDTSCETLSRESIYDFLSSGRGDCLATLLPEVAGSAGSIMIGTGELVCLAPSGHAISSETLISVDQLAQYPIIGWQNPSPHSRFITALFEGASRKPEIKSFISSPTMAIAAAEAGAGIVLTDNFSLPQEMPHGVNFIKINDSIKIPAYVHWTDVKNNRKLSQIFISSMRRVLKYVK